MELLESLLQSSCIAISYHKLLAHLMMQNKAYQSIRALCGPLYSLKSHMCGIVEDWQIGTCLALERHGQHLTYFSQGQIDVDNNLWWWHWVQVRHLIGYPLTGTKAISTLRPWYIIDSIYAGFAFLSQFSKKDR